MTILTVAQIIDLVSQFNIILQTEISRMVHLSLEGSEVGKKALCIICADKSDAKRADIA